MKINLKRLAMTAMLLCSTSMSLADDGSSASVGDLPGFGEDAYFEDVEGYYGDDDTAFEPGSPGQTAIEQDAVDHDVVEQAASGYEQESAVSRASVTDPASVQQAWISEPEYAPIRATALQPVAYDGGTVIHQYIDDGGFAPAYRGSGNCDGSCDGGCDGGCGTLRCCDIRKKIFDCNTWATYEALLWFPQARSMPILVASADPGQLPILSPGGALNGDVNNEFGGKVGGELSAGFRADYGKWIHKNVGVGGRFWWLGENGDSRTATGLDGTNGTVGRPFFETNPSALNGIGESALLVAFSDLNSEFVGDVSAESELDMLAAEAYGRFRMGSSNCHHLDFIGGYSYFQVDDKLRIGSSTTTVVSGQLDPPPGTFRTFDDFIKAENRFNGGQLGFELTATRGCWMVRSLTKVHLGNMQQTHSASGRSTSGILGGPPPAEFDIGMLVQDGNDGTFERDVFTFVPEANFKLAYRFRPHVLLSVGYSFLYFDDVTLAGASIDRAINGPLLGTGVSGVRPSFVFDDSSLWVQGIDLGAVIDF